MINSVNRALETIIYLANNGEVGVRELARFLNVNEATAYRILSCLEKYNFVNQDKLTAKYRLGPQILTIGHSYLKNFDIVKIAKPYLIELNNKTKETVCLLIKQGEFGVYVDKIDCKHAVRVHAEIGARIPLCKGGAAKSLIAFLPLDEQQKILNNYESDSSSSFNKNRLIDEFTEIKEKGYAISDEEIDSGVFAVGCPVFNHRGEIIASVSIPMPKVRVNEEHLNLIINELRETCREMSAELGYKSQTN